MITYKIINDKDAMPCAVNRSDGWSIPLATDNTDCQAFKAWLKAGNFPQNPDGTTATQAQVTALITQLGG